MHVVHCFDRRQAPVTARRLMFLQTGLQLMINLIIESFAEYFVDFDLLFCSVWQPIKKPKIFRLQLRKTYECSELEL